MSYLFKMCWLIRGGLYKIFFGRFSMPSYIGPPCFIYGARRIFVGRRVRIFPGLRAECHGIGRLYIHDNVAIGQGLHITCMGDLHIGRGTLITGYVSITDIEHEYEDVAHPVLEQPTVWRKTHIGQNCFFGMGARIQAGTILGNGCVVGANAVVRGEFPDHCVIVGAPARIVRRYDPVSGQWERC